MKLELRRGVRGEVRGNEREYHGGGVVGGRAMMVWD